MLELRANERLAERFQVVGALESDEQGSLLVAKDCAWADRPVLLKPLMREFLSKPDQVDQLRHDIEVWRKIDAPALAQVYEFVEDSDFSGLCFEAVQGKALREILQVAPPNLFVSVSVLSELIECVEVCHQNGLCMGGLDGCKTVLDPRGQLRILPTCMISSSTSLDVRKARDILFVQKALWKMIPLAIQRAAVGSCWSLQRQSRPSRDAITLAHEIEVWLGERITQRDVVSIEDLRQVTHALREELHTYQPLTGEQLLVLFGAISVLTLYVLSAWSL